MAVRTVETPCVTQFAKFNAGSIPGQHILSSAKYTMQKMLFRPSVFEKNVIIIVKSFYSEVYFTTIGQQHASVV